MIFVNDQKFACESCIKGHRSSSCQHTNRPLFEIKKKGRPVSQCEKCRELRKTKRMHNKCSCASGGPADTPTQAPQVATTSSASKSRRFKAIAPALPNGLKSFSPEISQQNPSLPGPSSKAPTSPNSCFCGAPECQCVEAAVRSSGAIVSRPGRPTENGLAALAAAAAICYSHDHRSSSHEAPSPRLSSAANDRARGYGQKHQHGAILAPDQPPMYLPERFSPEGYPSRRKRRRSCSGSDTAAAPDTSHSRPLDERSLQLPPIRYAGVPDGLSNLVAPAPNFPPIPSLREMVSLAGTGCCCGVECTCPGCVQHRGQVNASKDFPDCADGCGTCVDNEGGVELPSTRMTSPSGAASGSSAQPNFIDAFFARAAALPPPPASRTAALDATNMTVYPTALFKGDPRDREARGAAFGLVSLPPLQCGCSGGCGCPAGRCGCGDGCGGCC